MKNDKERQVHLQNDGLTIFRFLNDLVEKNLEEVQTIIGDFILKNRDEKQR